VAIEGSRRVSVLTVVSDWMSDGVTRGGCDVMGLLEVNGSFSKFLLFIGMAVNVSLVF